MEQILLNDITEIPPKPEGPGDDGNGLFSFIYRGHWVDEVQSIYGRTMCCFKIFKHLEKFWKDYEDQWWGFSSKVKGSKLKEATLIQNIFASHGLAPRVYAHFLVTIKKKEYWAQLTDDLGHWEYVDGLQHELITGRMKEFADFYHITLFNDGRDYNVVGGKYVDFQGFHLPENYTDELKQRMIGVANVGKWGPWMNYHSIPELGITGGRNNEKRIKDMHLDEIDFKGKTVLDVGCSEGFFCRYAMDRGAKRVIGIDLPGVITPTRELTYYLGYNNIDYVGMDLLNDVWKEDADIVFYFSMCQHVGFPMWLKDITQELLVFEGNGKNADADAISKMGVWFSSVEKKGKTDDLLEREVVWAKQ